MSRPLASVSFDFGGVFQALTQVSQRDAALRVAFEFVGQCAKRAEQIAAQLGAQVDLEGIVRLLVRELLPPRGAPHLG